MTSDQIMGMLLQFGLFTAGLWGLTEILHNLKFFEKRFSTPTLNLLIGIVLYPILTALGILSIPIEGNILKRIVASVLIGAIAIGMSGLLQDKFVNPAKELFRR